MKVKDWLARATKELEASGIGSARLDALILLEDELCKGRSYILAHQDGVIKDTKNLDEKLARRAKHEPLSYLRGFTEFYGRKFLVNKNVLEPRPESETMLELLFELNLPKNLVIADIGTGSGALAITAKLELPKAKVNATDIDPQCLVVARKNAKHLNADTKFLQGDLLQPILSSNYQPPTIILANLPYVPDSYTINEAAAMEPRIAIFGGPDGLDLYRKMFEQINNMENKPKYILTESLPPQHKKLEAIANKANFKLLKTRDFIQVFQLAD